MCSVEMQVAEQNCCFAGEGDFQLSRCSVLVGRKTWTRRDQTRPDQSYVELL
jgi:hypothetical protein